MKKTVKIISIIAVSVAALILVADVARRLIPEKKAQPARTEEVKLITEEDRNNGRWRFVCTETVVIACSSYRDTQ